VDGFIQKPVQEAELLKIVDTFIDHDDPGTFANLQSSPGGGVLQMTTGESPGVFRVLLAEDSRANQMAISRGLRAQGVDVTVVGRCRLKRVGTSVESTWFQRLNLE
jgi:hypothetical protein